MYTGHSTVGKIIAQAAAKTLTPITLELGGKNPVIVMRGADLRSVARRLLYGKVANSGQICLAPDYVMILQGEDDDQYDLESALVEEIKYVAREEFYPGSPGGAGPGGFGFYQENEQQYSQIINERHYKRLQNLVDDLGVKLETGGVTKSRCTKDGIIVTNLQEHIEQHNSGNNEKFSTTSASVTSESKFNNLILPTLLFQHTKIHEDGGKSRTKLLNSKLMHDEIFGPLLPFISGFKTIQEIQDFINGNTNSSNGTSNIGNDHNEQQLNFNLNLQRPLALYIFANTSNKTSLTNINTILNNVPCGGVCVNDTLFHQVSHTLPFGGVGQSGYGRYHGKWGFDEFSHKKGVMWRGIGPQEIVEVQGNTNSSRLGLIRRWYNFISPLTFYNSFKRYILRDFMIRYPPYQESTVAWIRKYGIGVKRRRKPFGLNLGSCEDWVCGSRRRRVTRVYPNL